jgi:hypothetical protein
MAMHLLAAGPDWGTVPDWLAAVGTLAAFAVALGLFRKEQQARRESEDDRRREQASRVASWVGVVEDLDSPPLPWASEMGRRRVAAVLHNGSEEPVYDCRVHIELDPAATGSFWKAVAGTFQPGERRLTLTDRTLPPGRIQHPLSLGRADLPHASVWMTFTDAAGRRWKRHPDGRLVEPDRPPRRAHKDELNDWIAREVDQLDY